MEDQQRDRIELELEREDREANKRDHKHIMLNNVTAAMCCMQDSVYAGSVSKVWFGRSLNN